MKENLNKTNMLYRRTSYMATSGSMTIEAALVVPLFIFCILNLLFGIQVIETSSRITASLHETGNEICSYGYAIKNGVGDGLPVNLGSLVYASANVAKHLGSAVDKHGGIKGGIAGINYLGSSVMRENDIVKLSVSYSLKYPVNMGIRSYRLGTTYYGHAWTGYGGLGDIQTSEENDPIVYITPTGSVYHSSLHCSHLNIKTNQVLVDVVGEKRSADGSKYYPCSNCNAKNACGSVYITEYGNRYHSALNCSELKRTATAVHLSEAEGRRPCSTCGK